MESDRKLEFDMQSEFLMDHVVFFAFATTIQQYFLPLP